MLVLFAKLGHFWRSLDRTVTVSKREIFLGMTTCALAGVVVGFWTAPKRQSYYGSTNCNNVYEGNVTTSGPENTKVPPEKGAGRLKP